MSQKELELFFNPKALRLAWERVVRWNQRAIKDYYGIKAFGAHLEDNLEHLSESLIQETYRPTRPQKFYMPKASRTQRTLTKLVIEDALVYQAIANRVAYVNYDIIAKNNTFIFGSVLSEENQLGIALLDQKETPHYFFFKHYPDLYKQFSDSVRKAIIEDKVKFKFETDITGFFDCIPHFNLLDTLSSKFQVPDVVLNLFAECLNCWSGTRSNYTFGVGIPQGPDPSAFMANVLLNHLDNALKKANLLYYRYMDDIRIYDFKEEYLVDILIQIDIYMKSLALSLNAKKTSIVRVSNTEADVSLIRMALNYDDYMDDLEELEELEDLEDSLLQKKEQVADIENQSIEDISFQDALEYDPTLHEDTYTTVYNDTPEARKYWYDTYNKSLQGIYALAIYDKTPGADASVPMALADDIDEQNMMRTLYHYRRSRQYIITHYLDGNNQPLHAPPQLIQILIWLLVRLPWRCNHICWAFRGEKGNHPAQKALTNSIEDFFFYEGVRHIIYNTLTTNFDIDADAWQLFYEHLKADMSEYARMAIYVLLLCHQSTDEQLFRVTEHIKTEKNAIMKKELLYYTASRQNNTLNLETLKSVFGL